MNAIRWILAAPFLLLGAWAVIYHWRLVASFIRVRLFVHDHKWEYSVPLAGFVFFLLGSLLAPMPELLRYSWVSLVIDPANYVLLAGLPTLLRNLAVGRSRKRDESHVSQ